MQFPHFGKRMTSRSHNGPPKLFGVLTDAPAFDSLATADASRRQGSRIYDQRFCRMWEFYLVSCEMAFCYGGLMVFQAQLARQLDSVPLTRDYMYYVNEKGLASVPRDDSFR
jgi:hypothetical protein